jgi:hypothetical protein
LKQKPKRRACVQVSLEEVADFQTMREYHLKRCEVLGANVKPFKENEELETLYRSRVRYFSDYESCGLINYIDKDHKEWRYTWKGAFLFVLYATVVETMTRAVLTTSSERKS